MKKKYSNTTSLIRDVKRRTRRKFSAEEKIRIVIEGLRGEESISAICRKEGIHPNLYYNWSKEFLEAGKKRLNGDVVRQATSSEVLALREENTDLKLTVAELFLENQKIKKTTQALLELLRLNCYI